MTTDMAAAQPQDEQATSTSLRALLPRLIMSVFFMGAILLVPAGRLDWGMGWVIFGFHLVYALIMVIVLRAVGSDVGAERSRFMTKDTKGWDKVFTVLFGPIVLSVWVVAGLNVRFGWPPEVNVAVQLLAFVVMALGYALFGWAMVTNRYFSRVVRIQEDRGHKVVTGGPYQYVRHPGYAGFIPAFFAMALALGSIWALIPAGITAVALIVRTALEDRTLQSELDGYQDYADDVRFRLLPGVW